MPKAKGPLLDTPETADQAVHDPSPRDAVVDAEPHVLGGPVHGREIDHDAMKAKDQAAKEAVGDTRADAVVDDNADDAEDDNKPKRTKKADLPVHLRKATFDQVFEVKDLHDLPDELKPFEGDIRHDEDLGSYIRLATAEGTVAVFEGMWLWESLAADGMRRWHAGLSDPRTKG